MTIVVTDSAGQLRRHVEWGLEGQSYNSATSLLIDSDDMVTSGFAGSQTTGAGAYDPNASGNNVVQATLFFGKTIAVCGTGNLAHVGVFRVKARIQTSLLTNPVRLSWKSGDGPMTSNAWVLPVSNTSWVEVDLGTITLQAATVGTQRWTGQIEARGGAASPGVVIVDYLILVPSSAGYGRARAVFAYSPGLLAGLDSFVGTTAGNPLATRTAPLGGSWATSGDTGDYVFSDSFPGPAEGLLRTTSVVETTGRFAILGSTSYTDVQVEARMQSSINAQSEQALVARWVDASNHLRFVIPGGDVSDPWARVEQVVGGVVTTLDQVEWVYPDGLPGYTLLVRLIAFSTGRIIAQIYGGAGEIIPTTLVSQLNASTSVLATGGTLQTGKPGLWDHAYSTSGPSGRLVTDFAVSVPALEQIAIYSGRNLQISSTDTVRQDSTGTYVGRPQSYRGSRALAPVGTSRVLVKARRNDVEADLDDNVTDRTMIQIVWTPRGLAVPR